MCTHYINLEAKEKDQQGIRSTDLIPLHLSFMSFGLGD